MHQYIRIYTYYACICTAYRMQLKWCNSTCKHAVNMSLQCVFKSTYLTTTKTCIIDIYIIYPYYIHKVSIVLVINPAVGNKPLQPCSITDHMVSTTLYYLLTETYVWKSSPEFSKIALYQNLSDAVIITHHYTTADKWANWIKWFQTSTQQCLETVHVILWWRQAGGRWSQQRCACITKSCWLSIKPPYISTATVIIHYITSKYSTLNTTLQQRIRLLLHSISV